MTRYVDPMGRVSVTPTDLDRRQMAALKSLAYRASRKARKAARVARRRQARGTTTPQAAVERLAAEQATMADRARAIAAGAWAPTSVDEYMDSVGWFAFERGDDGERGSR